MIFKIVALVIIALLLVIDYAMLVVAHRADEKARRMERAWEERRNEQNNGHSENDEVMVERGR